MNDKNKELTVVKEEISQVPIIADDALILMANEAEKRIENGE